MFRLSDGRIMLDRFYNRLGRVSTSAPARKHENTIFPGRMGLLITPLLQTNPSQIRGVAQPSSLVALADSRPLIRVKR